MTTLAWIGASVGYVVCGLVTARALVHLDEFFQEPPIAGINAVLWPLIALIGGFLALIWLLGKLASLGLGRKG